MEEPIKIKLVPRRSLYQDEDYQVYACTTEETSKVELDSVYNTFVISGEMPKLQIDHEYEAELEETKYKGRTSYKVVKINIPIPLTIEEKHNFLRSILPPSQAEGLIASYPNEDIIQLFKEDKIDIDKVKGIGRKTYHIVKEKVLQSLEYYEAIGKLAKYDLTYNIVKKIVDKYGSTAMALKKIEENPYVLTEIEGFGFIKVDEIALKLGVPKDDPIRIEAAGVYILNKVGEEGHCWEKIEDFYKKIIKFLDIDEDIIKNAIQNSDKFIFIKNTIGLKHIFNRELNIKNKLYKLMKYKNNFVVEDIENKIRAIEEEQGFKFTEEQKNGIYKVIENNVVIISGKAGSGKTSLLKGIFKVLSHYKHMACALSGKAAQRIAESTGFEAQTIHRGLAYHPKYGFRYNEHRKLPVDIVNLDEGSMVDSYLFEKLINAIEYGKKLIILGDIEQLPPIGAGNVMRDLIESGKVPVVELTKVHRQALRSGILLAANHVRSGKQLMKNSDLKPKIIGELKDLYLIPKMSSEEIFDSILKSAQKAKESGINIMDFQVIVPMKDRGLNCTKKLNIELQQIFNPNDSEFLQRGDFKFKTKDKVIKNGNDYDNEVFNGTMGIVDYVGEDFLQVVFDNGKRVTYEKKNLSEIDLAYALTIHRCQGSQFPYVIIGVDYSSFILLSRQLIYTALTRASKGCKLIFEPKALEYAVNNNDSNKRNTYLKQLMMGELDHVA